MLGAFNDPRIANAVGSIFGGASENLRTRANTSIECEEFGERATDEPSFTNEVINQMRTNIAQRLKELSKSFKDLGTKVRIEFHPTNLPVGDEEAYGADIGISVTIQTSQVRIIKGLLVQCKRMYGPRTFPKYNEIRGRGEDQAKKMLRVTPASFFMLFNFGEQSKIIGSFIEGVERTHGKPENYIAL